MPDYAEGVAAGSGGGDVTPPTVTIISPTPGVAPGEAGGFPLDPTAARATPIVLRVTDAVGLAALAISQVYRDAAGDAASMAVVYWRGAYVEPYYGDVVATGDTQLDLTVNHRAGWPMGGALEFDILPVDKSGNVGGA